MYMTARVVELVRLARTHIQTSLKLQKTIFMQLLELVDTGDTLELFTTVFRFLSLMFAWFSAISGLFEAGLRFCFSVLPTVCSRSFVAPPPCWSWDLDQFYFSYIILANQKLTVKTPSIALERVKATVSPWADLVISKILRTFINLNEPKQKKFFFFFVFK